MAHLQHSRKKSLKLPYLEAGSPLQLGRLQEPGIRNELKCQAGFEVHGEDAAIS